MNKFSTPGISFAFSEPKRIRTEARPFISTKEADSIAAKHDFYTLHRQYKKPRKYNPFFLIGSVIKFKSI